MSQSRKGVDGRGVTLVELLIALVVVAVLSTAIAIMLVGAGQTNSYVTSETDAMSQVENAYRRIMSNIRTCAAITTPTNTTATNTLTVTGVDGNSSSTVTYSITGGNLVEYDSRFNAAGGTSILVTGVQTFSVTRITGLNVTPSQITITITSNTTPQVTRTATITCRNI